MSKDKEWSCWEITKCEGTDNCLARKQSEKACWEIAGELEDYRSVFNVCTDCIVYLLKHEGNTMPKKKIRAIVKQKISCALI